MNTTSRHSTDHNLALFRQYHNQFLVTTTYCHSVLPPPTSVTDNVSFNGVSCIKSWSLSHTDTTVRLIHNVLCFSVMLMSIWSPTDDSNFRVSIISTDYSLRPPAKINRLQFLVSCSTTKFSCPCQSGVTDLFSGSSRTLQTRSCCSCTPCVTLEVFPMSTDKVCKHTDH